MRNENFKSGFLAFFNFCELQNQHLFIKRNNVNHYIDKAKNHYKLIINNRLKKKKNENS
jgi:hypothetical protein